MMAESTQQSDVYSKLAASDAVSENEFVNFGARSPNKLAELGKRLNSVSSPADLQDVLKNISEAQTAEKESIKSLKKCLRDAKLSKQEKPQRTHTGSFGDGPLKFGDDTSPQEMRAALIALRAEVDDLKTKNNALSTSKQEMSATIIALRAENEALKADNNILTLQKQQANATLNDNEMVEKFVEMQKNHGMFLQQFDSMADEYQVLAQRCGSLVQSACSGKVAKGGKDKFAVVVESDGDNDDLSSETLDSDEVSTNAGSDLGSLVVPVTQCPTKQVNAPSSLIAPKSPQVIPRVSLKILARPGELSSIGNTFQWNHTVNTTSGGDSSNVEPATAGLRAHQAVDIIPVKTRVEAWEGKTPRKLSASKELESRSGHVEEAPAKPIHAAPHQIRTKVPVVSQIAFAWKSMAPSPHALTARCAPGSHGAYPGDLFVRSTSR